VCSYDVLQEESCNDYDGCYTYDSGCEDRDYFCSDGSCLMGPVHILTQDTPTTTMIGFTIARETRCGSTGCSMTSIVKVEHVPITQVGRMTNWLWIVMT
jgi:hypothetical protein